MRARLAALAAITMWGLSFVATKVALGHISPVALIVTRFGMGIALLFALLALRRELRTPPRHAWAPLLLMGALGVFVHQLLQANALTFTSAISTGWLIGLTPLWSALLGVAVLGERLRLAEIAGLALGFGGAVLVVTGKADGALTSPGRAALGDLLIVVSTLNWAVYTVAGRNTLKELGAARATAWSMLLGWFLLLPLFLKSEGWREWAALDARTWGAVAFLGIGCSGLGYLLWYRALEEMDTARVAVFLYIEPLVTLAAAMALLHERPGIFSVVGGLLVLAGVALSQKDRSDA